LVPLHGPHVAPLVPQDALVVLVTHAPVESQQPFGQLVGVHRSAHCPELHDCALVHVWQDVPPVPQVVDDSSVWQRPSVPQQPLAHVVLSHGTAPSPPAESPVFPPSPASDARVPSAAASDPPPSA
jgi:hypothetical protein